MSHVPAARIWIPDDDRREVLERIDEVLRSGALTLGAQGRAFEEAFARTVGVRHAVAVSSGTSALEIALRILEAAGREVVVPTNTFFATAAAVIHAGGRPRFADIEPTTLALSLDTLREALTPSTAGVILVHIGGLVSPETPKIVEFCRERDLFVLEDAAHAHGSTLGERPAGTFGDVAAFSFYPTKVITSGEGGMLVTDNDEIDRQARQYRDQGKESFLINRHVCMGSNWRMSELHAALGLVQLRRLEVAVAERRRVAAAYTRRLHDLNGIRALAPPDGGGSNFYKYPALLDAGIDRSRLKRTLRERFGVSLSGEVYDHPCHQQPVFADFNGRPLPVAEDVCARHICLPLYPGMTDAEIDQVVTGLAATLTGRD